MPVDINLNRHGRWISFFVHRPGLSFLMIAFLIGSVYFISSRLATGFLPEMDEGSIVLDYTSLPGTSLQETDRSCVKWRSYSLLSPKLRPIQEVPELRWGSSITEPNYGDYLIQLRKTYAQHRSGNRRDPQKVVSTQPALKIDFGQVIGDMLGDLMSSTKPVEIKIYGDNADVLHGIAKEVAAVANEVKGTADVFNGITVAGPSLSIEPNSTKLAQFGITLPIFSHSYKHSWKEQSSEISSKRSKNRHQDDLSAGGEYNLDRMKNGSIFLPNGKLQPISTTGQNHSRTRQFGD